MKLFNGAIPKDGSISNNFYIVDVPNENPKCQLIIKNSIKQVKPDRFHFRSHKTARQNMRLWATFCNFLYTHVHIVILDHWYNFPWYCNDRFTPAARVDRGGPRILDGNVSILIAKGKGVLFLGESPNTTKIKEIPLPKSSNGTEIWTSLTRDLYKCV